MLCPEFSDGPWTLVRFSINKILPEDFDLDRIFRDTGITVNTVSFVVEHKHPGSYELVVVKSCLSFLSERYPDSQLTIDYDPFMPTEENVIVHGI